MQLIIDIPEKIYNYIKRLDWSELEEEEQKHLPIAVVCKAVKESIPLPKGHGRLKDIDAFLSKVKADREHSVYVESWTADDVLNALNNSYAPTIIEADGKEQGKEAQE